MFNVILMVAGTAALFATCAFAWWKGGPAAKMGGGFYAFAWVAVTVVQTVTHNAHPVVQILLADTVVATGFLILAVRYSNLWLGTAMMLQGLELFLHATYLTGEIAPNSAMVPIYAMCSNMISFAILAAILGGVLASRRAKPAEPDDVFVPIDDAFNPAATPEDRPHPPSALPA